MTAAADTDDREPVEMSDRQNDIIAFSLIYLWASLIQEKRRFCGGPLNVSLDEIEGILHAMEMSDDIIMEHKLKLLKGELP